jgi:predicted amidophosphoribosyltransferase
MVKLFKFINSLYHKFVSLTLPYRCLCCDEIVENYGVCIKCWSQISFINHPMCHIMGKPMDAFNTTYSKDKKDLLCQSAINNPPSYKKLRSVATYDKTIKKIIHRLKYNDSLNHSKWIAKMMRFYAKEVIKECNIIIPVPLHKIRLLSRNIVLLINNSTKFIFLRSRAN